MLPLRSCTVHLENYIIGIENIFINTDISPFFNTLSLFKSVHLVSTALKHLIKVKEVLKYKQVSFLGVFFITL